MEFQKRKYSKYIGCLLGGAVGDAFDINNLELADVIVSIADDLYRSVESGVPQPGADVEWDKKYRQN